MRSYLPVTLRQRWARVTATPTTAAKAATTAKTRELDPGLAWGAKVSPAEEEGREEGGTRWKRRSGEEADSSPYCWGVWEHPSAARADGGPRLGLSPNSPSARNRGPQEAWWVTLPSQLLGARMSLQSWRAGEPALACEPQALLGVGGLRAGIGQDGAPTPEPCPPFLGRKLCPHKRAVGNRLSGEGAWGEHRCWRLRLYPHPARPCSLHTPKYVVGAATQPEVGGGARTGGPKDRERGHVCAPRNHCRGSHLLADSERTGPGRGLTEHMHVPHASHTTHTTYHTRISIHMHISHMHTPSHMPHTQVHMPYTPCHTFITPIHIYTCHACTQQHTDVLLTDIPPHISHTIYMPCSTHQ